ncbi:hypothetical protein [Streptomyces sp. NPDC053720]|uniref:hypothetical protein n=1 Tax=Streptomyces sp. NPDC053720 TaxID=3154855 RepID=UPI00343D0E05
MTVNVEKTGTGTAVITWSHQTDDPRGYLSDEIESGRLEDALAAIGASTIEGLGETSDMRRIAQATTRIQALLERRMRGIAVELRDQALTWAEVADALYGDPTKRSSAQRAYEAGMRQRGLTTQMGRSGGEWEWPNKLVTDFSDAELADAIERNETDPDPVTRDLVGSCVREWERRKGLRSE